MYRDDRQTPAPNRQPGVDLSISEGGPVRRTPDINHYQQKKTLAQGMMDLALLSANANQLRIVIEYGTTHKYFYTTAFLISFSILLQICVGVLLVWNSAYDIKVEHQLPKANAINNFTVMGVFLITVVNVLVASFGPGGEVPVTSAKHSINQFNSTTDMINSTSVSFINTTAEVFMKGTTLLPSLEAF